MPLATEAEIHQAYQGKATAARYVRERFSSELNQLLHDEQVAAVKRAVDRVGLGQALEIAPGPGRITRHIHALGTLVCLEYNAGMIAEGRRACNGKAEWVQGNAFHLPFAGPFDLVYSFRFIRHFRQEDRSRLYAEVARILKPGGYLVLDAVNERVSGPLRKADPGAYPIYDKLYRDEGELRQELAGAGFTVAGLEPVQKHYRWQSYSQVLIGPRANWLNRLVIRGLERLPGRNPLEWMVTCRRG